MRMRVYECMWIAMHKCVWPVHGISRSSSIRPMYRQRCVHAAVRCDCTCVGVSDRSAQYTLSKRQKKRITDVLQYFHIFDTNGRN